MSVGKLCCLQWHLLASCAVFNGIWTVCTAVAHNASHVRGSRYGEDPFAITENGRAYIAGLQYGPGVENVTVATNPRGYRKIGSVAKHLAAYNFEGCIGNHNYPNCPKYRSHFDAIVDDVDLEETYYHAWRELAPEMVGAMCTFSGQYV